MGWAKTRNRLHLLEFVPGSDDEPLSARAIAVAVDWPWQTVRPILEELVEDGTLERSEGQKTSPSRYPPFLYRKAPRDPSMETLAHYLDRTRSHAKT